MLSKAPCLQTRPGLITSCRTSSWSDAEPFPSSGTQAHILQLRSADPPQGLSEAETPCRCSSASSARPWSSRILVMKRDMKLVQTVTAAADFGLLKLKHPKCILNSCLPVPSPATNAAPKHDISMCCGLATFLPNRLAVSCMTKSLEEMPPSTLRRRESEAEHSIPPQFTWLGEYQRNTHCRNALPIKA